MSVEKAIDKIKSKDQAIDTEDRIDSEQLTQQIVKVDTFLNKKINGKLQEMESKLSPEDYREFQKRMIQLEMEFDTELGTLQYKIDDIALDTEEEYREVIESYSHIFDGMEEDIKEYEHILGDDKELSEDELIAKVKEFSYAALFLDENTYENGNIKQLVKGVIDSMVIENAELAKQVFDTKGAILVDMMKTIFSWDGLKQIAKGLGESIWGLFSGDVYKTGRSIGELGLITTGAGIIGVGLKKGAKIAMKQIGKKAKKGGGKDIETKGVTGNVLQPTAQAMIETVKKGKDIVVALVKKGAEKIKDGYSKLKDEVRQLNEPIMVTNEGIAMPVSTKSQMDGDGILKKGADVVTKTGQKLKGKLKDSDYVRILANERGSVLNPFGKKNLESELPVSKGAGVNTQEFLPDFDSHNHLYNREIIALKGEAEKMLDNPNLLTRMNKLNSLTKLFIETLTKRDIYTGGHALRVAKYSEMIGEKLLDMGKITKDQLYDLKISMLLHDMGKLSTNNKVLNKLGKLSERERMVMSKHAKSTKDIIDDISILKNEKSIVDGSRHHHERWDGKGYPEGLQGENIDLFARISSVADTFDAVTSTRPYRDGQAINIAIDILAKNAGTQFDAEIANIFLDTINQRKLNKVTTDVNNILEDIKSRLGIEELEIT